MLVTSISYFSHSVFYPFQKKFYVFNHIYVVVCKFFELGPVLNFAVWYRVKREDAGKYAVNALPHNGDF